MELCRGIVAQPLQIDKQANGEGRFPELYNPPILWEYSCLVSRPIPVLQSVALTDPQRKPIWIYTEAYDVSIITRILPETCA